MPLLGIINQRIPLGSIVVEEDNRSCVIVARGKYVFVKRKMCKRKYVHVNENASACFVHHAFFIVRQAHNTVQSNGCTIADR